MKVINKRQCPYCHQTISARQIVLFTGMVKALWKVMRWCQRNNKIRFSRKEIKSLFENENQVARFGDWIMFGDILHRDQAKGHYEIDMDNAVDFFTGRSSIPTVLWKDPITGKIDKDDWRTIQEIPNLTEFLDENKEYIAVYSSPASRQKSLF